MKQLRIALAGLALLTLCSAAPQGANDRVHARRIVKNVPVATDTYYRTPWVYVWGARQVVWQLDCAGAVKDTALTVHFADDTTITTPDSLAAPTSTSAAISQVGNVSFFGTVASRSLVRKAGKNYLLTPITASTAGPAGAAPYLAVKWARLSVKFGSTDTTSYNGCDSLNVKTVTIRDWIFGSPD